MILEVLILSLLSLKFSKCTEFPIIIKVMEETNANNVFQSLKTLLRNVSFNLNDILFLSRNNMIHVNDDGDISFKEKIDLETLCTTRQICCGVVQCLIEMYIPFKNVKTNSLTDGVKLELEIIDKNDHKPEFLKSKITLHISESANLGTNFPIDSAVDRDFSPINRIQDYTLIDPSNTVSFNIERHSSRNLYIKVVKPLDFELRKDYKLTLRACDPDFCTNQTIDIIIRDENDNLPKFETSLYNITIKETLAIGRVILIVKAVDLDRSINYSFIKYKIDSKTIDQNILSTFIIEELSGKLILLDKLNAKTRSKYTLQIIASDSDEGGNIDSTTVVIFIEDENTNAPIIDILYPSNGQIVISENQPPQQISILSVTDNDLGINSLITCDLPIPSDNENFMLKSKSRDFYTIHSLRQFNYEIEQLFFIQIRCRDFGLPPLTTINSLKISILDENEFSPVFIDFKSRAYIKENSPPHSRLLQMKVSDADKNATLTYKIDNETESALLRIDINTGWIFSTENNIDRETIQEFSLVIVIRDTLGPDAKTVSTTVHFQIEDENDNRPQFTENFHFRISENIPVNTLVGKIWATDADEGGSSVLKYSLLRTLSSRQKEINNLFLVKSNGFIDTQGEIDRELDDKFTLLIAVTDDNFTENNVTVDVTISVDDENDNVPVWLVPTFDNAVFNITINYKIGDLILQLVAKDSDASNNGRIQYMLAHSDEENEKSSKFFHVNASTGNVYVVNHLSENRYQLKLEAIDFGSPPKRTSTILIIYVYGQDYPVLKIAIVASMITVTGIISFFLIVAIICVRNHSVKRQAATKDRSFSEIDDSLLKSKAGVNFIQQTPDFLTLLGSDNGNSAIQIPMISCSHRHINEYIDADSGDSGNGTSDDGLSSHCMGNAKVFMRSMNQSCINYATSSFVPSGLYPHPCFSLPENATIPQFSNSVLEGQSSYDLSATYNINFSGFLDKYPSLLTTKGEYPINDLYSQLSQI